MVYRIIVCGLGLTRKLVENGHGSRFLRRPFQVHRVIPQDGAERRNQEEERKKSITKKQADNGLVVKKGRIFCLNLRS